MVGSVGGDGGQVESDAGDRSADDDPWRALAETAVRGVGQRAEDDVGDQGEDDADGVHRAEDRFALTDAERVEAGWEQHGGSDGAGHHEDDAEEDEARAEASKIQFAYRFTGVGSEFLGGSSLGWSVFFGAIAVMIPFGYWFTFANTHEIASMKPGDGVDGRAGRIPVGDHFKALARNKYWWLTLGLNFALWTYNGMAAYIAKYVLGNSNLIAVIGLATVIPMVIGLPFAGPLVARFGKRNASMAGLVLVAVGSLLVFVDPSNLWVFFVSIIVRMVGIIPMNAALNAMSGDVVEYGEWRSGVRSDGIVFSSSSFSMKVAMGVSSAAIAWILGASGYDGSLAVRSDATVSAMVNTFVWVPVAMVVVMAALLFFYDLDKRVDRVGGELAARRV